MPDRSESNTENGAEDELSTSCTTDIDCALSEICAEGLCSATDERDHRGSEALLEPLRGYAELCRNNCERAIVCGSPEHLSAEECIDFNCTVVANLEENCPRADEETLLGCIQAHIDAEECQSRLTCDEMYPSVETEDPTTLPCEQEINATLAACGLAYETNFEE